jgi:nucleolar pre-ribosomal-associated protein 1
VDASSPTALKATFLERHTDALRAIFKGLGLDPYPVVHRVLEVFWAGIWSDAKLKRSLKIQLFNEHAIAHVCGHRLTHAVAPKATVDCQTL